MADGYRFEASFGGVRIDVTDTNTTSGRRVFPHEFPKKDGASTEDQGKPPLVINLNFLFVDRKAREGDEVPIEDFQGRFEQFLDLLDDESVRTLVHPYFGQVRCRISNFQTSGNGEVTEIRCSATFTEDATEPAVLDIVGEALQTTAGAQAVRQATEVAVAALEAQGLSSSLPEEAATIALGWDFSVSLSTRAVQTQMAEFNSRLQTELATFTAGDDVDSVPIIQSYTLLQYRLRKAAEAFTGTVPRIVEITTEATVPLRAIAASFYGAAEADRRFQEMLELNPSLRQPACVPPQVTLKAYSRNVRPREFSQ